MGWTVEPKRRCNRPPCEASARPPRAVRENAMMACSAAPSQPVHRRARQTLSVILPPVSLPLTAHWPMHTTIAQSGLVMGAGGG